MGNLCTLGSYATRHPAAMAEHEISVEWLHQLLALNGELCADAFAAGLPDVLSTGIAPLLHHSHQRAPLLLFASE